MVRDHDGDVLTTDGPFAEGKEHIGGFSIIRRPISTPRSSGAARLAQATTLPIEVRPFNDQDEE